MLAKPGTMFIAQPDIPVPLAIEKDAFRANRSDYRICEPLLTFYHVIMRPYWAQLLHGSAASRVWERSKQRFTSAILGPHFERICREWSLYFADDRFGDWPVEVSAGTVSDPARKGVHQVDVAVIGHASTGRPSLLAIGEAKWNDVMGLGHLERLRRIRELLADHDKFDTTSTRLVCYSGAGFTDDLRHLAASGDVDLVSLEDLYCAGFDDSRVSRPAPPAPACQQPPAAPNGPAGAVWSARRPSP